MTEQREPLILRKHLQAAELDKRSDVIPVFLIILPVCLAHPGQLVCHLLRNIVGNLLYKAVILQCESRFVQRQIRSVAGSLEQHQEFRNYFFDIIRDEDLVVVQLDRAFDGIILGVDLREVQDAL